VTTTTAPLALRLPLATRIFALLWPCAVVAFLLLDFRPDDGGSWAAVIVFALVGAFYGWRLFGLSVTGAADGALVVRNLGRTRTVHRADVADVTVDPATGRRVGGGWAVWLFLRSEDAIRLDVTNAPLLRPFRRRLEHQAAMVRNWVEGRPRPFL
jgi:hypothetical protein